MKDFIRAMWAVKGLPQSLATVVTIALGAMVYAIPGMDPKLQAAMLSG